MGITGFNLFAQDVKIRYAVTKSVAHIVTRNLYGGRKV